MANQPVRHMNPIGHAERLIRKGDDHAQSCRPGHLASSRSPISAGFFSRYVVRMGQFI